MAAGFAQDLSRMLPGLLSLSLLLGLFIQILGDQYIRRQQKRAILWIIALSASLVAQNAAEYALWVAGGAPLLRTLVSIYGYCVRPVLIVLFYAVVSDGERTRAAWTLTGLNALVYLTALFSPLAFRFEGNAFKRGPLGFSCHVITGVLLLQLLFLILRKCRKTPGQTVIPVFNVLLIVAATVVDTVGYDVPYTFVTGAVVCSTMLFYNWLH